MPSRLADMVAQCGMTAWPAPVVRLFLGQLTPAALLAAADDPDAVKKRPGLRGQFLNGRAGAARGAKDEAVGLFRRAAKAELKALGVTP